MVTQLQAFIVQIQRMNKKIVSAYMNFYSRGFSMLEALFVLTIIALALLASVTYFHQASHQTQITAFLSEVKGIIQAAEEYNDEMGSFKGINATEIVKKHYIVPRYNIIIEKTNYLVTPWTELTSDSTAGVTVQTDGKDTSHMVMTIGYLPSFACEQVLNQLDQFMTINDKGNKKTKTFCIQKNTGNSVDNSFSFTYPKKD